MRRSNAPPVRAARAAMWLLAPLFLFDSVPEYSLSNLREYWGVLSNFFHRKSEDSLTVVIFHDLLTKSSQFVGKWPRCRGPPSKSLKTLTFSNSRR